MTPEISLGCNMSIDAKGVLYSTTTVYSFVFNEDVKENILFSLGILNSKLLWFFLKSTGYILRGGYFRFKTDYLKPFPVRTIDFSSKQEKASHDKMVKLVERMLELNKKLPSAKTEHDKNLIQRQIDGTDSEIDKLVYALYGLTEKEIKIVENGA